MPEKYSNEQAISRCCLGLDDVHASIHVCMVRPKTMKEAMNEVRKHTKQAMFGKPNSGQHEESSTRNYEELELTHMHTIQNIGTSTLPTSSVQRIEQAIERLQDSIMKQNKVVLWMRGIRPLSPGVPKADARMLHLWVFGSFSSRLPEGFKRQRVEIAGQRPNQQQSRPTSKQNVKQAGKKK